MATRLLGRTRRITCSVGGVCIALAGCLQYTTYYLTEPNPELAQNALVLFSFLLRCVLLGAREMTHS